MKHRDGVGPYVLVFFLCFFFLFSSGRIASQDAGQQLQASMLLAVSGRLGDDGRGAGPADASWVQAPNGRRYQPHDIGNIVLMLPAAWLGARLSPAPAGDDVLNPPALSRAGASLACSALAALGCYWMFRLLALSWPVRTAFLLAVAFPSATIFIAYARSAWDVLGGCCLMCGVLYYSARLLRGEQAERSAVMLAATLALACSFRYSLAPFMPPAGCVVVFLARKRLPGRAFVSSALVFAALILPSLAYNYVRTGSPLRPASAAAQYLHGVNALTGNVLHGLFGLFLSPNRGVFLFSPILVLSLVACVRWRSASREQRELLAVYGAASAGYVLLISKMANWGAFGWGPRYLLPVLPVMFFAAACGLMWLWQRARPLAVAVVIVSALLTVPPALVNWHLATTSFPYADRPEAPGPYQQRGAWAALFLGLRGHTLPIPANAAGDSLRSTTGDFPDLFLWRVGTSSTAGLMAATVATAAALIGAGFCAARVLRTETTEEDRGTGF